MVIDTKVTNEMIRAVDLNINILSASIFGRDAGAGWIDYGGNRHEDLLMFAQMKLVLEKVKALQEEQND